MNHLTSIILSNLFLVIVWISYELFLSKTRNFQANRFYLLGGSVMAVVIPWVPMQINLLPQFNTLLGAPLLMLREVTVNPSSAGANGSTWLGSLASTFPGALYLFIVAMLSAVSLIQFTRLLFWQKTKRVLTWQDHKVVILDKPWSAFSFFRTIYYPEPFEPGMRVTDTILEHEKVHARQLHSIDNMILMIIRILFFYNPAIYLIADKLRLNHEYIADEATAGDDKAGYSHALIKHQFLAPRLILMHSFNNQSFLKRRLTMLQKTKQKSQSGWKYLLTAPLIAGMILLSGWSASVLAQEPVKKETAKEKTNVEVLPLFQGSNMDSFMKWIGENVKYPEKAVEEKITGKVFVSFEISKKGEVENAVIAKSANPLLDEEALRVIKSSPAWTPAQAKGKPVTMKLTIPVNFVLDGNKK